MFNKIYYIVGTFNRTTKVNLSNIRELMNLLESSDYDKQIQSNGFSEYSYNSCFSSLVTIF